MILTAVLAVACSYVLGSMSTGLWLGLWLRGVDIRCHGSKNIGATNTLRVLGKGLGAAALVGDIGKGLLAVLLVARLSAWPHAPLACGAAAILGHTASMFLKFRGGKGVATGAGVFLGLCPWPTVVAAAVFAVVVAATRMVSAGSIAAAAVLCLAVYVFPHSWPLRIAVTLIVLLVVWRHRSNIQRIVKGQENRL